LLCISTANIMALFVPMGLKDKLSPLNVVLSHNA